MNWIDETDYTKGDPKRNPQIFACHTGNLHCYIHRDMHYNPDVWLFSCNLLNIFNEPMDNKDIDAVKAEVEARVKGELKSLLEQL